MTWVVAAVTLTSAVVASKAQSDAAKKAASTAAGAAGQATQSQLDMYNQTREDQAPWTKAGGEAVGALMGTGGNQGLIQKGPGEFVPENDPGYKFGYQEFVENPTLKLASATGKLGSGATLKALTRYASDYASTKYDNFLDRYYKSLDPYYRMAGLGSNVAISSGNQATETGLGVASTTLAGGQATAAGQLGSSYPYANLLNSMASYGAGNYKPSTSNNNQSLGTYSPEVYQFQQ